MMTRQHYRTLQNLLLTISFFVLSLTFYFQYMKDQQPCTLCLMQRYAALSFAFFCVFGQLLTTLKRVKYAMVFQMIFAVAGLFFASRQLWLQFFLNGQSHACLPDIKVLMDYFPWQDVVKALFWGTGDCSDTTWKLFGLPMSAWAAIYFLFTALMSIYLFRRLTQSLNEFSPK